MKTSIDPGDFRYTGKGSCNPAKIPTALKKNLYRDDATLEKHLSSFREEIDELQQKMFAHDRYSLLLIFQAMDAAGKDGTIKHVISGINPHGVEVHAFKRPGDEELDHDYLWRTTKVLPSRGKVGIFNRSYYEEVLVCRVHPEIVTKYQRLPEETTSKLDELWPRRFKEIRNFEAMLHANGTRVVKFFLHVSKEEQKKRLLKRIDTPAKNWKFNTGDLAERALWKDYMRAYEEALEGTATKDSPWYVVPADDKGNMRLIVSAVILHEIARMKMKWPVLPPDQQAALGAARKTLMEE
ncbi:MAG TPA: polyphosphate kinase 2 family protein [Verrucomicrobiales bacterium]|jgi:PPK2 family polyphosphate:nucleotide phosphotransferase|nr:polyphosphate kinase 2 family protein [Verrucomicrobiales bacterium]